MLLTKENEELVNTLAATMKNVFEGTNGFEGHERHMGCDYSIQASDLLDALNLETLKAIKAAKKAGVKFA